YNNAIVPVNCVCILLSGEQFLLLHEQNKLEEQVDQYINAYPDKPVTVIIDGLYRIVQMQANNSIKPKTITPGSNVPNNEFKGIAGVNDILTRIWFQRCGALRSKVTDTIQDSISYIQTITTHIAKAPYKESDH